MVFQKTFHPIFICLYYRGAGGDANLKMYLLLPYREAIVYRIGDAFLFYKFTMGINLTGHFNLHKNFLRFLEVAFVYSLTAENLLTTLFNDRQGSC